MPRTSLLVRCSEEEAQLLRTAAKSEGRTLSGYILNGVTGYIKHKQRLLETMPASGEAQAPVASLDSVKARILE